MSQELVQSLVGTLSTDTNTRVAAELQLANLLPHPETAIALADIFTSHEAEISLRQSAGIVLRKYIVERWSPFFTTYRGSPPPPPEVKARIRGTVFQGLSDPQRKIRTGSAFVLSTIAHSDWPEEYPSLLSDLMTLLGSSSADAIHGAMQVFTEFVRSDLTEDQILPVLRQLLPLLLAILGSSDHHSPLTRARTISVFRQCVSALFMVKDQHPEAVKEAVSTVIPVWLDAFRVLLEIDPTTDIVDPDNWAPLAIRIQIFKTLENIHKLFPQALRSYLPNLLAISVRHLTSLLSAFQTYCLPPALPAPPATSADDPDLIISLPQLGCPLFDFFSAVARDGKAKSWFETDLRPVIITLLGWIQITEDDEEKWGSDANAFVAEEDDETDSYSLRVAGLDLAGVLLDRHPLTTTALLQSATQDIVHQSQLTHGTGQPNWWRQLEALLAVVGSQAGEIMDCVEEQVQANKPKPYDFESLLSNVIPGLLSQSDAPFLQGRSFVFASQCAKALPSQLAGQYLHAAIEVLESGSASVPVKVSAVKTIRNFCKDVNDEVLVPHAHRIIQDLAPFLLLTHEESLSLVLETLSVVVEIEGGKWLSVELASSLTTALLDVWAKNSKDILFLSMLTELFESLAEASAPGVYETVVGHSLPSLCTAILNAQVEETWIANGALDIISSLLEGAKNGAIGDGFFVTLAPALFGCLEKANDRDVLQNGIVCLTLVIRKQPEQLFSYTSPSGQSGIELTMHLLGRLLSPDESESGGLVVGDLIIHLLRRAGDIILPVLPQLLELMVKRITTAQTATFLQSLIVPFAFMIHTQRDSVLSLLESMTITEVNPPKSGLEIFIQAWSENAETFQGFWANRISNLALCHVFVAERPSLQQILVKGDIIVKPETRNVIVTRSRAKKTPNEYASIPFPVKVLKLLLQELQSGGQVASAAPGNPQADAESDDGDDEWADEEKIYQGMKQDEFAFLSDMLDKQGEGDEDHLEQDDEDLREDPITKIDMREHLLSFFRECSTRNTNDFTRLVDQLNAEEMLVIRRLLGQ